MALITDQLSEFLAEIEAVRAEPVEDLGQTESPFKAFLDLTTYLGASPRLLDAVVTADLLNGEPEGVLMALGAHLLISAGGTAARALRGTGTKGTGKPLQMASGKITTALRSIVSKSVGASVKDISGNTVTGGMSGTLVRLIDEKMYHSVTPACRAAVSLKDLKDEIALAEKTIEDWTISKLVKTDLADSVKSGLLVSQSGAYKLNWEHHGKREERKVAITEQTTLRSEGACLKGSRTGVPSFRAYSATLVPVRPVGRGLRTQTDPISGPARTGRCAGASCFEDSAPGPFGMRQRPRNAGAIG